MIYVDVLLWVLVIVIITSILCAGISILWVETQREKWFNNGRMFEREEKVSSFKKTKGTRRIVKDGFYCALGCGSFANSQALDSHMLGHGVISETTISAKNNGSKVKQPPKHSSKVS